MPTPPGPDLRTARRQRALHSATVWALLFGLWVILSGKLDGVHLTMGALSAALVTRMSGGVLYSRTDGGGRKWLTAIPWLRFLRYLPWLGWEVVKANVQVLKLVLGPVSKLRPGVVSFRPELSSEISRVVLANSITLTPGTVTLDVDTDGAYQVHAIDPGSAEGLEAMARKVAWAFAEERGGGGA